MIIYLQPTVELLSKLVPPEDFKQFTEVLIPCKTEQGLPYFKLREKNEAIS